MLMSQQETKIGVWDDYGNQYLIFASRIYSPSHSTSKRTRDSWTNRLLPKCCAKGLEAAVEDRFDSNCHVKVFLYEARSRRVWLAPQEEDFFSLT
jgi:hypothetical protein